MWLAGMRGGPSLGRWSRDECASALLIGLGCSEGACLDAPSCGIQKFKRAVSCMVREFACVSWPKLPEPVVVTSPYKLV